MQSGPRRALIPQITEKINETKQFSTGRVFGVINHCVLSIAQDNNIIEAAEFMISEKVQRLLVMKNNRLLRIISATDLLASVIGISHEFKKTNLVETIPDNPTYNKT